MKLYVLYSFYPTEKIDRGRCKTFKILNNTLFYIIV